MNGEQNIPNKSEYAKYDSVEKKKLIQAKQPIRTSEDLDVYRTEIFGKERRRKICRLQKILDGDTHKISAQDLPADLCRDFVILLSPEAVGCRENAEIATSARFSFPVI